MTRVKVCGLTRQSDAELAIELGASAIGFVFEPTSPRCIREDADLSWIGSLGPYVSCVSVYGVSRRNPNAALFAAVQAVTWDAQPELWQRRIGVLRLGHPQKEVGAVQGVSAVVLDAYKEGLYGGTGERVDWGRARELVERLDLPVVLAGGLTPENVGEAVRQVRPYAVDVSSGIESSPGVKDGEKMRAFIKNAREADR